MHSCTEPALLHTAASETSYIADILYIYFSLAEYILWPCMTCYFWHEPAMDISLSFAAFSLIAAKTTRVEKLLTPPNSSTMGDESTSISVATLRVASRRATCALHQDKREKI